MHAFALLYLALATPGAYAADATTTNDMSSTRSSALDASTVLDRARATRDYVVGVRRELHANPELMWSEHDSAATIERELTALGIDHERVSSTGVIGTIGRGARSVGLRADVDALPLTEETELEYASRTDGKI